MAEVRCQPKVRESPLSTCLCANERSQCWMLVGNLCEKGPPRICREVTSAVKKSQGRRQRGQRWLGNWREASKCSITIRKAQRLGNRPKGRLLIRVRRTQ